MHESSAVVACRLQQLSTARMAMCLACDPMHVRVRRGCRNCHGGVSAGSAGGRVTAGVALQEVALKVTRATKAELALREQKLRQERLDAIEVRCPTTCGYSAPSCLSFLFTSPVRN